jgi:zinc/manganese transport system substrate-binding protein
MLGRFASIDPTYGSNVMTECDFNFGMLMNRFVRMVLAASAVSACAVPCAPAADKLKVTATFSILADITQRIGGDQIEITALVKPAQDVHVYQPTPTDAAALSKSQVLISNGLNFEGWMNRLVSAAGFKGLAITASDGIAVLDNAELAHKHTGDGAHSHADPHAWQDIATVLVYVSNIKDALCRVDSADCETYTKNAERYSAELRALDAEIKAKIAAIPADKRKVITSHDAFGYFGRAYGVTFLAPLGISTEEEASAASIAKLITQIRSENIKAVFVETVSNARLIEQIARETGATVGSPLYADTLSGAGGPAATYIDMMRTNANALAAAMAKN